mgnify:CR=1 FL=1
MAVSAQGLRHDPVPRQRRRPRRHQLQRRLFGGPQCRPARLARGVGGAVVGQLTDLFDEDANRKFGRVA